MAQDLEKLQEVADAEDAVQATLSRLFVEMLKSCVSASLMVAPLPRSAKQWVVPGDGFVDWRQKRCATYEFG